MTTIIYIPISFFLSYGQYLCPDELCKVWVWEICVLICMYIHWMYNKIGKYTTLDNIWQLSFTCINSRCGVLNIISQFVSKKIYFSLNIFLIFQISANVWKTNKIRSKSIWNYNWLSPYWFALDFWKMEFDNWSWMNFILGLSSLNLNFADYAGSKNLGEP